MRAHETHPTASPPVPPLPGGEVGPREARIGVLYGLAAFGWWGLITIYFKAVAEVPALEVLAYRVLFSVILLWGLLAARRRCRPVLRMLADRRNVALLAGSTTMIASNWLVFIWAIGHSKVTQASLGYFINPLFNVLLGYCFLGERLRGRQPLSVLLAAAGVATLSIHYGQVPTIALVLPATFGLYGLIRKKAPMDSVSGLTAETTLLMPAALAYVAYLAITGRGHFGTVSLRLDFLLAAAGVVTALPLIWFLNAARRLRFSTLGFLQYLAPTLQLALGVLAYGEPFHLVHFVSFALVWAGLLVYAVDTVRPRA
jgi:chloramphenicol-sensitive protein RarD